jgi:uncharacterized protein YyaL (SSP411 family)
VPNQLALEASPYLRQHADQPVDWLPWGAPAFERARRENRPVLLSIGYAACHWCHVMAQESFADPRIAALLNEHFVAIKVDRQERPDVDELYQRVVQLMGEGGGWPLTVFLTPQQEPFFGGTYFPPEERYGRPGFARLLQGLARAWRERPQEVEANCAQFLRGLRETDEQLFAPVGVPPGDLPAEAAAAFAAATDPVHGGLGSKAPRFPNASCLDLMLRVQARGADPALRPALARTLDAMAAGGLRDQLGGGFARYSVDERWAVPHFEKMLYDNAQLVKLYADAARATGHAPWLAVAQEAGTDVLRELRQAGGGFCASLDADSEGEEGRYYLWTPQQIEAVLGAEDGAFACAAYGVDAQGNFAGGRTVLARRAPLDAAQAARLAPLRERLRQARTARPQPARDDNIVAAWNGLMIQGLCALWQAGGGAPYLEAARAAADFIGSALGRSGDGLARAGCAGQAQGEGFLDDYAEMAHAHFDLYESAFDPADLARGLALAEQILARFWDEGLYYTPAGADPLVHRPLAPLDGACPSGLSSGVLALLRAHALGGRPHFLARARALLERYEAASARNFFGFAHLLAAREFDQQGPATIGIEGLPAAPARALAQAVQRRYRPAWVLGRAQDLPGLDPAAAGAPGVRAWICRAGTCLPPLVDAAALERLLEGAPSP